MSLMVAALTQSVLRVKSSLWCADRQRGWQSFESYNMLGFSTQHAKSDTPLLKTVKAEDFLSGEYVCCKLGRIF